MVLDVSEVDEQLMSRTVARRYPMPDRNIFRENMALAGTEDRIVLFDTFDGPRHYLFASGLGTLHVI